MRSSNAGGPARAFLTTALALVLALGILGRAQAEIPVPSPVSAENAAPVTAPAETPVPTTAPIETPAPTRAPTETPVPTRAPTETAMPAPLPTETAMPAPAPAETPVPAPTSGETSLPAPTPAEIPAPAPTEVPGPVATLAETDLPAPAETPAPAPVEDPAPSPAEDPESAVQRLIDEILAAIPEEGRFNNVQQVFNQRDGRLRIQAKLQIRRISDSIVNPVNIALARASCTDCQTIAVALQLDLIEPGVTLFQPENLAVAINQQCTNCDTVALATQHVITVSDRGNEGRRPEALREIEKLQDDLEEIEEEDDITFAEAMARINALVARFNDLAMSLDAPVHDVDHRDGEEKETTGVKRSSRTYGWDE